MRFKMFGIALIGSSCLMTACTGKRAVNECGICESDVVVQSYVHKYGMEVPEKEWSSRGKSGKVVSTLKTGVIVTSNYIDGFLEGETTYSFPHSGAIQKIETYAAGQLVKEQEMYASGKPKKEVQYHGRSHQVITEWYENGAPRYREEYDRDKLMEADYYSLNGQVESKIDGGNGIRMNRDEFGQLVSQDKLSQGELVLRTFYYPNGTPKEMIPYYQGKVHGQRKTYLPGGEPKTLEAWSEDKQEGMTVVFQHGEKAAQVPYFNGLKNGVEERYKDDKYIVEEITWKNGKKHGPCTVYIGEGSHVSWYYEGQEVNQRQFELLTSPSPR